MATGLIFCLVQGSKIGSKRQSSTKITSDQQREELWAGDCHPSSISLLKVQGWDADSFHLPLIGAASDQNTHTLLVGEWGGVGWGWGYHRPLVAWSKMSQTLPITTGWDLACPSSGVGDQQWCLGYYCSCSFSVINRLMRLLEAESLGATVWMLCSIRVPVWKLNLQIVTVSTGKISGGWLGHEDPSSSRARTLVTED